MFERASAGAAARVAAVSAEQWQSPTPCSLWDVRQLVDHMRGGPAYLLGALHAEAPTASTSYGEMITVSVETLRVPGALDRRCMSPAGFEWTVGEATAGTAMDQLVHTWDLAVATGAGPRPRGRGCRCRGGHVPAADARRRPSGRARRACGRGADGRASPGSVAGSDGSATVTGDDEFDDAVKAVGHAGPAGDAAGRPRRGAHRVGDGGGGWVEPVGGEPAPQAAS